MLSPFALSYHTYLMAGLRLVMGSGEKVILE